MQFDDRLATVLRMQTGNARASGTQYRQLLDLVGSAPAGADDALLENAYARLGLLSREISAGLRTRIVGEPGLRLRNPELVAFLSGLDMPTAMAALAAARLDEDQWNALIPALPGPVRALLRHRDDLPAGTRKLLADLGVQELALPEPEAGTAAKPDTVFEPHPANDHEEVETAEGAAVLDLDPALELAEDENAGIGAIVRRIEAFQRARKTASEAVQDAPRLPLGEELLDAPRSPRAFDFSTDADGRIEWADPALAPMSVGISLASEFPEAQAIADETTREAMRHRLPIRAGHVTLVGAAAIAGEWRIDAVPHFSSSGGRFTGYRGRMRRSAEPAATAPAAQADSTANRIRQMLHELRTPVNAIQGFSEMIQQQVLGPAPHEYRALAATIAGDAARILAGFDELDRLARLESGAIEPEPGSCDFRAIAILTVQQLDGVLRPRGAGLELEAPLDPCPVALPRHDGEVLAWRILATLAGAVSPGEALRLALSQADDGRVRLAIDLPASLAGQSDIFDSFAASHAQAVSAGMFGTGFTFRLARAEARAIGGNLVCQDDMLLLALPGGGEAIAPEDTFAEKTAGAMD